VQQDSLRYPSCRLSSDLDGSPINSMAGKYPCILLLHCLCLPSFLTTIAPSYHHTDFTYLAALAYREVDITQSELDSWFGPGVATDNPAFVDAFKNTTNSLVSFKVRKERNGFHHALFRSCHFFGVGPAHWQLFLLYL